MLTGAFGIERATPTGYRCVVNPPAGNGAVPATPFARQADAL